VGKGVSPIVGDFGSPFFFFLSLMLIGIVGLTIANRGGEALLPTITNKKKDWTPFFF
jgi:hypothetical protein